MSGSWVLLRGLMREQRHWGAFPQQLAWALPGAVIATPDLPGNGQRHRLDSPVRVAGMVEFLRRDLRVRGVPAPYHLLALSLGGMVAVEWARLYPDEIAGLVLINTSMRPFSPFYRRLRWQNYAALLALPFSAPARQERTLLRLTSSGSNGRSDQALLRRWTAYRRDYPVARMNALRQLLAAARFTASSGAPQTPLLLLASRADRLVDVSCSHALAGAWRAELRLHPHAGHDLPLDDGPWVAEVIRTWLGRIPGQV